MKPVGFEGQGGSVNLLPGAFNALYNSCLEEIERYTYGRIIEQRTQGVVSVPPQWCIHLLPGGSTQDYVYH